MRTRSNNKDGEDVYFTVKNDSTRKTSNQNMNYVKQFMANLRQSKNSISGNDTISKLNQQKTSQKFLRKDTKNIQRNSMLVASKVRKSSGFKMTAKPQVISNDLLNQKNYNSNHDIMKISHIKDKLDELSEENDDNKIRILPKKNIENITKKILKHFL